MGPHRVRPPDTGNAIHSHSPRHVSPWSPMPRVLQDSLTREQIAAEAAADVDSTWRMGEPIPEPTHWPQPPPDMDPALLLSSVHLDDPDNPISPELMQPEGPLGDLGPGQILTPRRRSASGRAAGMVSSARSRTQGAPLAAQQAIRAPPAQQQQLGRPSAGQASVPAPGESRPSTRVPSEPISGVLSSAGCPERQAPPQAQARGCWGWRLAWQYSGSSHGQRLGLCQGFQGGQEGPAGRRGCRGRVRGWQGGPGTAAAA